MSDRVLPSSASVDPEEAAFYQRLAAKWWDASGPFWPLHRLNTVRIGYLRASLEQHFGASTNPMRPLAGLRILDIGCGGGLLSEALAKLGADVHGVDIVEKNLSVARLHAESQGLVIRYQTGTAEELSQTGAQYDAVMNLEVVEHVADIGSFLAACCRLVRPGGLMAIATLNRTALAFLGAIVLGEYVMGWLPRGTHRWSRFCKPKELERMLNQHGMDVIDRIGVRINPVTRSFTLSRFQAINFMMVATKPQAPFPLSAESAQSGKA
jgi:2-polyprenyl-6-hydroxyphenyl methylase/3-demethylubiquinone-9 3-methyltransferase